jgi:AcrR family transcriptional regulator
MGLREQKAERTRREILDAALRLFETNGYDATTMEQIAEAAFVSPSTLYRYFPTKERTLLGHPALARAGLGSMLLTRPDTEPLAEALGHTLHDFLTDLDADRESLLRVRAQMDRIPLIRALAWDSWYQGHAELEAAVAERIGARRDDLLVRVSAGITLMVAQMALDESRAGGEHPSATAFADRIMQLIGRGSEPLVTLPRHADDLAPHSSLPSTD